MKEITRVATITVTRIETVPDEVCDKKELTAQSDAEKMKDCLLINWMADDVTVNVQDFIREV